jgi:hypothetical protein
MFVAYSWTSVAAEQVTPSYRLRLRARFVLEPQLCAQWARGSIGRPLLAAMVDGGERGVAYELRRGEEDVAAVDDFKAAGGGILGATGTVRRAGSMSTRGCGEGRVAVFPAVCGAELGRARRGAFGGPRWRGSSEAR